MVLNQLLPKGFKIPEITMFDLHGISYDIAKSYLVTLPVTDRTLGIEIIVKEKSVKSYFFIEFYKTELPLNKVDREIFYPSYAISDYYNLFSDKSSVFPFNTDQLNMWDKLKEEVGKEELIIIQSLFIKKTNEKLLDVMWTQYEDYVNGIDTPTHIKPLRFIQNKMLEIAKKIEGGYRKNVRIPESEKKLREDLFRFECRFSVTSESDKRRRYLSELVKSVFSEHNSINSWSFIQEKNKRKFFEHMQFRRLSLIGANTYLSPSELASFFVADSMKEVKQIVEQSPVTKDVKLEGKQDDEFKANPLSIFPKGKKKNRENDIFLAQNFNNALRKLSLIDEEDVVINKIQHGSTVQRITFSLPEGLKLTTLNKAVTDIQAELAMSRISFEQGEQAGTAALVIPQEERESVFVGDCIENEGFKKFIKDAELPLLFGVGTLGDVVYVCLTAIKHLLICGTTGSGKSVFLNTLLTVLFSLVDPKNLQVFMIDPKMIELSAFESYPHVQKVYTEMNEVEGVLCYICEQMDDRYRLFRDKGGYKNIQQYNRNESVKLPYILVVIEELADLMSTNAENEEYIVRLAQKARAAGIHLIIATQYPIKEVVTSLIKRNIVSRACFALDSGTAYKVALDETPSFDLLGKGDGVYRFEGKSGIHRFQSPLIGKNEEEQDRIIKKLSTYWTMANKKVVIDTESAKKKKVEKELTEFKKFILETGETRITELQKLLSVRTEKVKQLMDELVSLGWVVKHKSRAKGYELVLSEEDRKRYLEECAQYVG